MGSAAWPCSIQTKWCDIMGLFGDRHCIYRDNRRGDNGSSVIISKKGNLKSPGQLTEWGGCLSVDTDVFPAAEQAAADVVTEMEAAVKVLLQGLGEDPEREGLVKTPLRVAQAFLSATRGYRESVQELIGGALFSEAGAGAGSGSGGGSGGIVVVQNINLFSSCEACLSPFRVRCHIAYIPAGERVVGLSKLPRIAQMFAKRLQTPQKYADEVVEGLADVLKPLGVAIVVESWHLRWPVLESARHMQDVLEDSDMVGWVPSTVHASRGQLQVGTHLWDEFVTMLEVELEVKDMQHHHHCPFYSLADDHLLTAAGVPEADARCVPSSVQPLLWATNGCGHRLCGVTPSPPVPRNPTSPSFSEMVVAVKTLLLAAGEDPSRTGLQLTPARFVRCLLTSTRGNFLSWGMNGTGAVPVNGYSNGGHCAELLEGGAGQVECGTGSFCVEPDLPFFSQCEHHLLPFAGSVQIGYDVGMRGHRMSRTTLQKIVTVYSQRLQVQERLTRQIAESVAWCSDVQGVIVKVEASHMCMVSRGIEKIGSVTATVATLGRFVNDPAARLAFLSKVRKCAKGKE